MGGGGRGGGIVQALYESRGGRPGLSVLTSLLVSVDALLVGMVYTEPCFGIGHNLSLICHLTSEDIKHHFISMYRAIRGRENSEYAVRPEVTACGRRGVRSQELINALE